MAQLPWRSFSVLAALDSLLAVAMSMSRLFAAESDEVESFLDRLHLADGTLAHRMACALVDILLDLTANRSLQSHGWLLVKAVLKPTGEQAILHEADACRSTLQYMATRRREGWIAHMDWQRTCSRFRDLVVTNPWVVALITNFRVKHLNMHLHAVLSPE